MRALTAEVLSAGASVVATVLRGTDYVVGALDVLESAVRAPGPDARVLAVERGGVIEGVLVFGTFAGTMGAGRLHFVAVSERARRLGIGRALVDSAVIHLKERAARFLLVELPDDPRALPCARAFLAALGFHEESRVEDLFRDAIGLSLMRRAIEEIP